VTNEGQHFNSLGFRY